MSKDKKFGALEIGMSIFWGLSIGFGTGFVGTGGGMMITPCHASIQDKS